MKINKLFSIGMILALVAILSLSVQVESSSASTETYLINDEFNGSELDSSIWSFQSNSAGTSYSVSDGQIYIYGGNTPGGGGGVYSKLGYTPDDYSSLTLEFRARWEIIGGGSFWDAVNGWASFGINRYDYKMYATVLESDYDPPAYKMEIEGVDPSEWHVYKINISGTTATFYVDNIIRATFTEGVPHEKPIHVRIGVGPTIDNTGPKYMYLDYVRLFENIAPTSDAGGPYLVKADSTIPIDGTGSDPNQDTLTYSWFVTGGSFDDASLEDPTYFAPSEAGIYELTLTVTDQGGLSDQDTTMVVVYNLDGGFVTGGGWIDSPADSYNPEPSLTGKANFGFVSKYKKGASIPSGNTEFQFHAADLNFHSSSYNWLVVNQDGTNAQFKGLGTINGQGEYKFMLWAGDDEPDTFRIKIWTEDDVSNETVYYDNGFDQAIGGGGIVIHTKNK